MGHPRLHVPERGLHLQEGVTTRLVVRRRAAAVRRGEGERHREAHDLLVEILRLRIVLDRDPHDAQPEARVRLLLGPGGPRRHRRGPDNGSHSHHDER